MTASYAQPKQQCPGVEDKRKRERNAAALSLALTYGRDKPSNAVIRSWDPRSPNRGNRGFSYHRGVKQSARRDFYKDLNGINARHAPVSATLGPLLWERMDTVPTCLLMSRWVVACSGGWEVGDCWGHLHESVPELQEGPQVGWWIDHWNSVDHWIDWW